MSSTKDYLSRKPHFNADGEIELKSVFFAPKKAPPDMMDNYWTNRSEVKLYVRQVLVAEEFEELLLRCTNVVSDDPR